MIGERPPVKVCRGCGAVGEYAGFVRPCPTCREAKR